MKIKNSNFSIKQIRNSGQAFRTYEEDDSVVFISKNKAVRLWQDGDEITFSCSEDEFNNYWKNFFDLDFDYSSILKKVDQADEYLMDAVTKASGLRILRQDLFEMIISFTISQRNNIPRIEKSIQEICQRLGEHKTDNTVNFYTFPSAEALANAPLSLYRECGLGYRDVFVSEIAKAVATGEFDLKRLQSMNYQDALDYLMTLKGVGIKVANCVCLFGLHHTEAFPIDTHMIQILDAHYKEGFPFEKYEGFAGILQQYMFYGDLKKNASN